MVLIITGTIAPASQAFLKVTDKDERLEQYISCIRFFINSKSVNKIIFCDNSDYKDEAGEFKKLTNEAKGKGIHLESLFFKGNAENVVLHGKGYGEGEIMEYIFSHSELIKGEDYFYKITGRLIVNNIKDIVRLTTKKNICHINIPNATRRDILDTRFYGMPVKMYREYFLKAYENVDDSKERFLEHVFAHILRDKKRGLKHRNIPRYPRLTGRSGSSGGDYVYTEWKCKIKDVLSLFNYYG